MKFFSILNKEKGAIAIQSETGLGRASLMSAFYLMKKFRMTAFDCLTYLKIIRNESVMDNQQKFLIKCQNVIFNFVDLSEFEEKDLALEFEKNQKEFYFVKKRIKKNF